MRALARLRVGAADRRSVRVAAGALEAVGAVEPFVTPPQTGVYVFLKSASAVTAAVMIEASVLLEHVKFPLIAVASVPMLHF